jgi:hypothetical protein
MAGEFLPPVVTTLDGDIQPLLDKLAEAKAAIKALGDNAFTIPINVELNQASIARARAQLAAELQGTDMTIKVGFDINGASLAAGLAAARAAASTGVTVPVRYDYGFQPGTNYGSQFAFNRMFGPAGDVNPLYQSNSGWNTVGGRPASSTYWSRGSQYNSDGTPYLGDSGGPGFFGRAWDRVPFQDYPSKTFPAPWFLGGGRLSYTAAHTAALGVGMAGMGIMGGLFDLGAMSAVLGPGVAAIGSRGNLYNQSLLNSIPPGVPDYAIARAAGYNGQLAGSPLARAVGIGNGMDLSALGGLVAMANKGGVLGSLVAQHGLSGGSAIDNLIGRMDLQGSSGSTLTKFINDITSDASNLGGALANTGAFLGHAFSHMPGEIEWASTGLNDVTGFANDIWKTPVLKTIAGDALFGGLLLHSTSLGARLLGNGLNFLGSVLPIGAGNVLTGAGGISRKAAQAAARAAALEKGATAAEADAAAGEATGSGLLGLGMFNPYILATAGVVGTGLAAYRFQNPTSAAIRALANRVGLGNQGAVNAGSYSSSALGTIGAFMQGAYNDPSTPSSESIATRLWNAAFGFGTSPANQTNPTGWESKFSPAAQQNAAYLAASSAQFSDYGGNVRAVANALGVSTTMAANILGQSGAQIGKTGVVGGDAMAIRLSQNYLNGQRINTGGTSMALMNIGVGTMTGDSAWQAATTINGNWDTYMGELGAGGSTLTGFLSARQLAAQYAANVKNAAPGTYVAPLTGLAATSSILGSIGEPGADFFRTAMAAGAIKGPAAGNSIAELAAGLSPYAGKNKAAQAQLVALANSGGGVTNMGGYTGMIKDFAQLISLTGGATKAEGNYTRSVETTTTKMADLPSIFATATKAATADQAGQIGALINKFPSIQSAWDKVEGDMVNKRPLKQTIADAEALATKMYDNKAPVSLINGMLSAMGLSIKAIQGEHGIHFTVSASMSGSAAAVIAAAGGIGAFIGTHQGPVNQNVLLPAKHAVAPGTHALGGSANVGQWSWVGEKGPELMYMPPGSSITPNFRTGQVMASASGGTGGGEIHNHIYLDGKEIFNVTKKQTYQYNANNGNRDAQGRVAGNMRPR